MSADPASAAVDEVLRRRARRLAEPLADLPVGAVDLLVFSVGDIRLAVPVHRVREVLPPGPTTRLPSGAPAMAGVRAVRSAVVALADPSVLLALDGGASPPAEARFAVVLDHPVAPVGLLADRVVGVLAAVAGIQPVRDDELLEGVTGDGVPVLDVDAVLAEPRLSTAPSDRRQGTS